MGRRAGPGISGHGAAGGPAGMYATASMRVGTVAGAPLIHETGIAAAWIAAAVWAAVFTWMTGSAAARLRAGA